MPGTASLCPGTTSPHFLLQGRAALQGTPLSSMAPVASPGTPQLQPHLHGTTLIPGSDTTVTHPQTSAHSCPTSSSLSRLQPLHHCSQPDPCTVTPPAMPVLAPIIPSHFSTANLLPPPSPAPICCEPTLSLPRYCSEWLIPWCSCPALPRQRGGSCPHSPACRCSFAPCTYPLPCSQPRVLSTRCASPPPDCTWLGGCFVPSTAQTATVQPAGRSLGHNWHPQSSCLP